MRPLLHFGSTNPVLNDGYMLYWFRMKQTQMYVCTLEEFISSRCSHIAVHGWSEILIGILTSLYTNVTIGRER